MGNFFALASFASFCVASVLGVYPVSRFQRDFRLHLLHTIFMLFAVWSLSFAMVQVSSTYEKALFWMRISSLGWGPMYSYFLHWAMAGSAEQWSKKRWVMILVYAPAVLNVLVFGLFRDLAAGMYHLERTVVGWIALPTPNFWNQFFSVYVASFILLGVGFLFRWEKYAQTQQEKRQARIIALVVLVTFMASFPVDKVIRASLVMPLPPLAPLFVMVPFTVIFYTIYRYGVFLSVPARPTDAPGTEVLDRTEKVRLYSFLSLLHTLGGISYVFYAHFVLREPLEKLFPWGALFVLFGMAIQYLSTLEVEERFRDFLYVIVISLVALVLAPRVHFLGEVPYASFFFTAVVVAILLGSLWAFVLQGVLMGGILLALWRPVSPSPQGNQFAGLHVLLLSFGPFLVLAFYVHQVYLRRLRENQAQLEYQGFIGELASELVDVNRWNFEEEFSKILHRLGRHRGEGWISFFLFSPYGREITGVGKWYYGCIGNPEDSATFSPEVFSWLAEWVKSGSGFTVERKEKRPEGELLQKLGLERAFLYPVQRSGELLGFLGWGTQGAFSQKIPQEELGKVLGPVLADVLSRIAQEWNIYHMALYDMLTGLPNRALFQDRLEKEIQLAKRIGKHLAVVFVDLDSFKAVNDAKGHEVGDELLRAVASRLSGCVREHDTVARFGGDEFLVLMTQLNTPGEIPSIVERIVSSLRQPIFVWGQEFFITASAGIAVYPEDGETPRDLLRNADLAMYAVKVEKGNGYAFFSLVVK